jgi:hypothetical protein
MASVRRIHLLLTLLLAALLAPAAASATTNDVAVSRLADLEPSARQGRLDFVVRELAMSISGPPCHAVASLGLYEFEVATSHRLAFQHTEADGANTSPWQDLTESGEPGVIGYMPTLTFRKGLPWSFEIGGEAGWLAGTRQLMVGGYGRWAFVGGWEKVPDVAIQLGYDGYVGNDQLELGVFELDVSVGYTFKASSKRERPGTRFSPFVGYSYLMTHARPMADVDEVTAVTGWAEHALAGVDARDFRFHRFFGGLEILAGQVAFRFSGDVTSPRTGPLLGAFNMSLGARF